MRQKKRHCTGSIGEGRAIATTEGGSLKRKSILEFRLRLRKGNHRSRCLASPRSSASYSLGLQSKAASQLWKSPAQINCQQKLNQTASQTYGVRPTSWSWLPAPVLWKKKVRRNSDEKKPEKLKKKGTAKKKDRRRSCQQKRSRCFFQRKSPSFETRFVYHVASPLLPLEHTNLRMAPNASRLGQAFLKKQQQPTKSIKKRMSRVIQNLRLCTAPKVCFQPYPQRRRLARSVRAARKRPRWVIWLGLKVKWLRRRTAK